jgi:MFS family permease
MDEWKRGWRVVLGATFCSAFGIPLFYYVFSLFVVDLSAEFGTSRGEMANMQALIVVGALIAPFAGRMLDRFGFAWVFGLSMAGVVATHVMMATVVSTVPLFALMAFFYGAVGIGCGPLAYTRPINAWFWHNRGLALGLAAIGLAITAAVIPPLLAELIEREGWRAGFWALAALAGLVALPVTLALVRDAPPDGPAGPPLAEPSTTGDRTHFRETHFWFLAGSMLCMAVAGGGLVSQISPLVQDEGIPARLAAFGVTAYALGQLAGRIVAGWFLDRATPHIVAFVFTFVPAAGFVVLAAFDLPIGIAVAAIALVGIQQGAEIDLFAYFVSRRFGLERYGGVYGWIIAASWLGNASGILMFGWLFDASGGYALPEWVAAVLLVAAAFLIAAVRLPRTSEVR